MKTGTKIQLGFIAALWIVLVYLILSSTPQWTLMTWFTIVASGIVVFVPLYKKHFSQKK